VDLVLTWVPTHLLIIVGSYIGPLDSSDSLTGNRRPPTACMYRSDIGEIIKKIKDTPYLVVKCLVIGTIVQDSILSRGDKLPQLK
jgi:hypothetical protein